MADPLEDALVDLGRSIETGPVPDVMPQVLARIAQPPPRRRRRGWLWGGGCAVVIAAVIGLTPGVAGAVGDFLGSLPGVLFSRSTTPPPPPAPAPAQPGPLGASLQMTGAVPLTEVRSAGIPVPTAFGDPTEVYRNAAGLITMVWPAGPGLPAIGPSGIGLIVDVLPPGFGPYAQKMLASTPERFELDGRQAVWAGEPHELILLDSFRTPTGARLAVKTLVVSLDPRTVRVESVLDKDRAIAVVRSLR